jgi:hypothetical protein
LVEIKLSTNGKLLRGYTRQLEAYKAAEKTSRAVYLVIDVGSVGRKQDALLAKRNATIARGEPASHLAFVDGTRQISASKR